HRPHRQGSVSALGRGAVHAEDAADVALPRPPRSVLRRPRCLAVRRLASLYRDIETPCICRGAQAPIWPGGCSVVAGGMVPSLPGRGPRRLSPEERKSLTHGDFWIPEEERGVYRRALQALNGASVPYVVAGAYAIYEHTGIYRQTKDLDVFVE